MNKDKITLNLATVICLVIIVLLLIAFVGMFVYYRNLLNKTEKSTSITEEKIEKLTPITAEKFKKQLENQDFNLVDAASNIPDSILRDGIKIGYLSEKKDINDFRLNFFEFKDEAHTMYIYYDEILLIESNNTGEFSESLKTQSNYSKYTAISNGNYIIVIRIDNTLIYGTINKENKDMLDNILKDLGYTL